MKKLLAFFVGMALVGTLRAVEPAPSAAPAAAGLDTALIERLTGAKGALDVTEGVFKVSVPRTDLGLEVNGVRVTTPWGSSPGPRSSGWAIRPW